MISWSADYLENSLHMQRVNAAQSVSLFLAAMIVGRMTVSRLVQRFSVHRVVIASIVLAGIGFALFWLTNIPFLGLTGLFVMGLGRCGYVSPAPFDGDWRGWQNNTTQASARASVGFGHCNFGAPAGVGTSG